MVKQTWVRFLASIGVSEMSERLPVIDDDYADHASCHILAGKCRTERFCIQLTVHGGLADLAFRRVSQQRMYNNAMIQGTLDLAAAIRGIVRMRVKRMRREKELKAQMAGVINTRCTDIYICI